MNKKQMSLLRYMESRTQKDVLEDLFYKYSIELYPIPSHSIIFDPYVQLKCQHCINYGSCFRCPPHTPRFYKASTIIRGYQYHYLLLMREDKQQFIRKMEIKHGYNLKRAINFARRNWDVTSYWKFHKAIAATKKILEEYGNRVLAFGPGGGCKLCRVCGIHKKEGCKHPTESLAAPESWGIDVYGTLSGINIPIEIPPRRVFTRVGLICINSEINIGTHSFPYPISNHNKSNLNVALNETSKVIGGEIKDIISLEDYYKGDDFCKDCPNNKRFICDRSFLPLEYLQEFIRKRKCVIVKFDNKDDLAKKLSEYIDHLHRYGHYDALPFSNYPCNLCERCNPQGCMLTNQRNSKKFGQKLIFRCIKYIDADINIRENNIGYILVEA